MAIHTLFSSGRLPENERGGIAQLQQGAVWIAYKPLFRVPSGSRGLFALCLRRQEAAGTASALPTSTPGGQSGFPVVSERLVEEQTRVGVPSPSAPR